MASVARKRTLTQAPLLCALAAVVAVLAIVLTGVHASFNQTQDEAVAEATNAIEQQEPRGQRSGLG